MEIILKKNLKAGFKIKDHVVKFRSPVAQVSLWFHLFKFLNKLLDQTLCHSDEERMEIRSLLKNHQSKHYEKSSCQSIYLVVQDWSATCLILNEHVAFVLETCWHCYLGSWIPTVSLLWVTEPICSHRPPKPINFHSIQNVHNCFKCLAMRIVKAHKLKCDISTLRPIQDFFFREQVFFWLGSLKSRWEVIVKMYKWNVYYSYSQHGRVSCKSTIKK